MQRYIKKSVSTQLTLTDFLFIFSYYCFLSWKNQQNTFAEDVTRAIPLPSYHKTSNEYGHPLPFESTD